MMWKILALGVVLLAGPDGPLTLASDRTVTVKVGGKPATLRIDPGAPSSPMFSAAAAARLGFRPSMIPVLIAIGPVHLKGHSDLVELDIGSGAFKRRAAWFDEGVYAEGADALIGPGGMPADTVRFELRAPEPGERQVTLPLADFGYGGMGTRLTIGGETVAVRFSLERDRTVATASGGAIVAGAQGGAFDAPPEKMVIRFGVERPVRHMKLATPLQIGPFALSGLMVRTSDFGSTSRIPDANAPDADPDEIVVSGERKRKKREQRIEIGRDQLDRCSSLVFDKPAKTITLSCR